MTRALVAVFKSQVMAEVDRRSLSHDEAAQALTDLAIHYAGKAGLTLQSHTWMLGDRYAALRVESSGQVVHCTPEVHHE